MTVERLVKQASFVALFTLSGVGLREFTYVFTEMDSNSNGVLSSEERRDYVLGLFDTDTLRGRTLQTGGIP